LLSNTSPDCPGAAWTPASSPEHLDAWLAGLWILLVFEGLFPGFIPFRFGKETTKRRRLKERKEGRRKTSCCSYCDINTDTTARRDTRDERDERDERRERNPNRS